MAQFGECLDRLDVPSPYAASLGGQSTTAVEQAHTNRGTVGALIIRVRFWILGYILL